jgi:hypothetical protein
METPYLNASWRSGIVTAVILLAATRAWAQPPMTVTHTSTIHNDYFSGIGIGGTQVIDHFAITASPINAFNDLHIHLVAPTPPDPLPTYDGPGTAAVVPDPSPSNPGGFIINVNGFGGQAGTTVLNFDLVSGVDPVSVQGRFKIETTMNGGPIERTVASVAPPLKSGANLSAGQQVVAFGPGTFGKYGYFILLQSTHVPGQNALIGYGCAAVDGSYTGNLRRPLTSDDLFLVESGSPGHYKYVVPLVTPPTLTATLSGKVLRLAYPASAAGFRLEAQAAAGPDAWIPVEASAVPSGETLTVEVDTTATLQGFYRLAYP